MGGGRLSHTVPLPLEDWRFSQTPPLHLSCKLKCELSQSVSSLAPVERRNELIIHQQETEMGSLANPSLCAQPLHSLISMLTALVSSRARVKLWRHLCASAWALSGVERGAQVPSWSGWVPSCKRLAEFRSSSWEPCVPPGGGMEVGLGMEEADGHCQVGCWLVCAGPGDQFVTLFLPCRQVTLAELCWR